MSDAPAVRECGHLSEVLSFMNTWPSSRDPSVARIFLSTPVLSFQSSPHFSSRLSSVSTSKHRTWPTLWPTCSVSQTHISFQGPNCVSTNCLQDLSTQLIPTLELSLVPRNLSSRCLSLILSALAITFAWASCDFFDTISQLKWKILTSQYFI
jgi:hypothetical protein